MLSAIQRGGQWVFIRVERIFNRAFGEAAIRSTTWAPITYFLFWIVSPAACTSSSFSRPASTRRYASVEYLTHAQWYLGGMLRSLHRYASDGMVLAMVLHLTRHFASTATGASAGSRGYRASSCCGRLVCGINGYMLPWDRLAQFVTVATAEWLDWLPMFNGTLVRNFIFEGAVNDRLFSLLSFLHIGFPLGLLALLWIHTQRVPGAQRPIRRERSWRSSARRSSHCRSSSRRQPGCGRPRHRLADTRSRLVLPAGASAVLPMGGTRRVAARRRRDAAVRACCHGCRPSAAGRANFTC